MTSTVFGQPLSSPTDETDTRPLALTEHGVYSSSWTSCKLSMARWIRPHKSFASALTIMPPGRQNRVRKKYLNPIRDIKIASYTRSCKIPNVGKTRYDLFLPYTTLGRAQSGADKPREIHNKCVNRLS